MNFQVARTALRGVLTLVGLVLSAAGAGAQERWTPDLILCGNSSSWVWVKNGDPCASTVLLDGSGNPTIVPAVHPLADFANGDFVADRNAAYFNKPNAFIEVVKPAGPGQPAPLRQLLVADSHNGRILRYDDDGTTVTYAGELAPNLFLAPFGIVGDADGNILVADSARNKVYAFDWAGQPIGGALDASLNPTGAYSACGSNALPFSGLPFSMPWRIALTPGASITPGNAHGQVLVIDGGDNRVVICDAQMNFVATFGNPVDVSGGDPAFFSSPTGIAVDGRDDSGALVSGVPGHIYVADQNNGRIQVFDATTPAKVAALTLGSAPVWSISSNPQDGTVVPNMLGPFGVAIDANGRLLAADQDNNAMYVFDTFANGLRQLSVRIGTASAGTSADYPPLMPPGKPGELQVPANISLDSTGRLLIADVWNQRVQRFNHPLMTVTVVPPPSPIVGDGTIVLTVAVQAASGTFLSVIPIATVTGTATVTGPVISPDAQANPSAPGTTVTAGAGATYFTLTYQSTGVGSVSFSVQASGIPAPSGPRVYAPDGAGETEPIAVGVGSDTTAPLTIATVAGTSVVVGSGATAATWYTTSPVVHLSSSGTPTPYEIDYKVVPFAPEPLATDYSTCSSNTCVLDPIVTDGGTLVWFRAKSRTAANQVITEQWRSVLVNFDAVVPGIGTYALTSPANAAGWNNSSFVISYSIFNGRVGLPNGASNPGSISISTATQPDSAALMSPPVTIVDAAGLTRGPVQLGPFKLDATAPTASCAAAPAANSFGWRNVPVTVTFTATDNLSGIAGSPTVQTVLNTDGAGQQGSIGPGAFFDVAGNGNIASVICGGINIDRVAPTVTAALTGINTVTFTPSDALSGVQFIHYAVTDALGVVTSGNLTPALLTLPIASNGQNTVTYYAVDKAGNQSAPATITVNINNQAPLCGHASPDQGSLWPPNHKFVAIGINGVTDPNHGPVTIAVTRIWQDESTMADGSGDTPIDAVIVNGAAQVRAERAGAGDGRVYQIFFTATTAGGSCGGSVSVGVPHDQSGPAAHDSGVRYDSQVANGPRVQ